jgi:hypothetical protein
MRRFVTALSTVLLGTLAAAPALADGGRAARPAAVPACASAAAVTQPAPLAPAALRRFTFAPRAPRVIHLGAIESHRAMGRTERAIADFERAIGRADRLGHASRRKLAALREDVLFLRGLLMSFSRDGRLDRVEIGSLDATVSHLGAALDAALTPRVTTARRVSR